VKTSTIIQTFDCAAAQYDEAAAVQKKIAAYLVNWASTTLTTPMSLLDVGSGTGFVSSALHEHWPEGHITAMDSSASMLKEAQRKLPKLSILQSDVLTADLHQKFDTIFSSMVLHWLPDPEAALQKWRSWLRPLGKLFVALPITGSFHEWQNLCRQNGVQDGLWVLPPENFAHEGAVRWAQEDFIHSFPATLDFLQSMKSTGASTARLGHRPVQTSHMRRMLNASPRPMQVTYRIAFLELSASDP
jgi:malonyl-CoA O-methyltransferase